MRNKMKELPKNWVLRVTEESLPFINEARSKQTKHSNNISLNTNDYRHYSCVYNCGDYICGGNYNTLMRDLEIDLETFKEYYIKTKIYEKVFIHRKMLNELYFKDICSEWRESIFNIVSENSSDESIEIEDKYIKLFQEKGTKSQKELLKSYGINVPLSEFEEYLVEHNKCELKVDDYVKVTRKFQYGENGVNFLTPYSMNDFIAGVHKIRLKYHDGYVLEHCKDGHTAKFPYFVLEKVEEEKYVPYTSDDNLVNMVLVHNKIRYLILSQDNDGVHMLFFDRTYDELLKDCTHTDGTPFGKLK